MAILGGKKSYLAGIAQILYGGIGLLLGKLDSDIALQMIGMGLSVIFLRLGIKKAENDGE